MKNDHEGFNQQQNIYYMDILNEFETHYQHLISYGMEAIASADTHISIRVPFIFNHKLLPENFQGLQVQVHVFGFPEEFFPNPKNDRTPLEEYYHPKRYVQFINKYENEIREKLNSPAMTKEEMLDVICWGDFKKFVFELYSKTVVD